MLLVGDYIVWLIIIVEVDNKFEQKKGLKADFTQRQQEYAHRKEEMKELKQQQQNQKPEAHRIPALRLTKCSSMYVHLPRSKLVVFITPDSCQIRNLPICAKRNLTATLCCYSFQQPRVMEVEHKDILVCQGLIKFCEKVSKCTGDEKTNKRNRKVSVG